MSTPAENWTDPAMDYMEWLRKYRPQEPRTVVLTGETIAPKDGRIGDFSTLTADQWHRAIVVRRYYERHPERRG